jgi:hypothetical protein
VDYATVVFNLRLVSSQPLATYPLLFTALCFFQINGKYQLNGGQGQPSNILTRAFEMAAKHYYSKTLRREDQQEQIDLAMLNLGVFIP